MAKPDHPTVIIGAGWAGLAAAMELCHQGRPVIVLEASKQLGGRTRRISFDEHSVDVGQHLLFGSYRHTLKLFQRLKLHEPQDFTRDNFTLVNRISKRRELRFRLPALPGPWPFLLASLFGRQIPPRQRLKIARLFLLLWQRKIPLESDLPLRNTLETLGQPEGLIRRFWAPLCQMLFHTEVEQLSSRLFLHWLPLAFAPQSHYNDFLVLHRDLGELFLDPAAAFIERKGGSIRLGQKVDYLVTENNHIQGIWSNEQLIPCQQVILAASAGGNRQLMAPLTQLQALEARLARLRYEDITTVYLRYPRECSLPHHLVHLPGPLGLWALDKRPQGLPGVISVQLRCDDGLDLDDQELIQRIDRELALLFPHWSKIEQGMVVRTRDATLPMDPTSVALRPGIRTPVNGLLLAGDFVDFSGPSTLESTVASGLACAREILRGGK